jgi:hypothetical protein
LAHFDDLARAARARRGERRRPLARLVRRIRPAV